MHRGLLTVWIVLTAIVLAGCSHGGGDTPTPRTISEAIYAIRSVCSAGATLAVSGTSLPFEGTTLTIPPGALRDCTVVMITSVLSPASPEAINFALSPAGLTLLVPATLTIHYTDAFLQDNLLLDPAQIKVLSVAADGTIAELPVTARDPAGHTVTVSVTQFGSIVACGPATQPPYFQQVLPRTGPRTRLADAGSLPILVMVQPECDDGSSLDAGGCPTGLVNLVEQSAALSGRYAAVYVYRYPWKRGVDGGTGEGDARRMPARFLARSLAAIGGSGRTVDVIALSMGGLVGRYGLEQEDPTGAARARIRNLFEIGTPGDPLAPGALAALCPSLTAFANQAVLDLTGASPVIATLKASSFAGFDGRYVTIAGDVSNPAPTGSDGVVTVASVRLDKPGSATPALYEHLTFQGPCAGDCLASGAGHTGLHCRANDPSLKGTFPAITSNKARTVPLPGTNVGKVLEVMLMETLGGSWGTSMGGPLNDYAFHASRAADGSYYVCGYTRSYGAGGDDVWVVKLNPDLTVAWQRTFGGAQNDDPQSVAATADGGCIVSAQTQSFGAGDWDLWMIKLRADGSVAWQKTYGGPGTELMGPALQTADGGYITAACSTSFGSGDFQGWVLKLNADGTVAWQRTYTGPVGATGGDALGSIRATSDGGYVVCGSTSSFGAGQSDVWVVKLDAGGSVAWQNAYGGPAGDYGRWVSETSDGGFVVSGGTTSFGAGGYDAWVLKLTAAGAIAWQRTYGGPGSELSTGLVPTNDGGCVVVADTNSYGDGSTDIWLLRLAGDGSIVWQKTYGGPGTETPNLIETTPDGGYLVAGNTDTFGAGGADFWVVKTSADGSAPPLGWPSTTVPGPTTGVSTGNVAPPGVSAATVLDTNATITDTSATFRFQAP